MVREVVPMKRFILIMCVLLLLFSACGSQEPEPVTQVTVSVQESEPELPPYDEPEIFVPDGQLEPEQIVESYLEQQYISYCELRFIDMSSIVDMSQSFNRNSAVWLRMLVMRRKLLKDNNLCYVETERFPYEITFIGQDELKDVRMDFWRNLDLLEEDDAFVHFVVTGEAGRAYPPMLALGAQHTMHFRRKDGEWRIFSHYYPGSVRKFRRTSELRLPSEDDMHEELLWEFAPCDEEAVEPAEEAAVYTGAYAAVYALEYTESPNPMFYNVGDWMGNCANFISQCIWYGFGDGEMPDMYSRQFMTSSWYAGDGGGSPAWENVDHFWSFATGGDITAQELENVTVMRPGDLMQVRTGRFRNGEDESFNHSLLLVDKETLMFAQNSPGCFVYYADLVNIESRILRPISLG